ncbi:MAG: electron transport complex subunit RsxC [Gammaproteobacteria bacterium]|jgi:electron transport complex protein RnfC|nr:electron transport complex subunit RsxC [Gammaproteobacteria bacterium]
MVDSATSFRRPASVSFDHLETFHGGLKLTGHRELTAARPILPAGVPPLLTIPLQQHIGTAAECLVQPGDAVYKGQLIARQVGKISAAVHASSSGTVIAVEERPVPHPSGLRAPCIVLETDGLDRYRDTRPAALDYTRMPADELCDHIRGAGIVGLGGAGFPTHVKLGCSTDGIEMLLINAVECEPYIACDNRLMQERAAEVIEGVRVLQHAVRPQNCIIAIEDGMPEAETALRTVLAANNETGITITRVPEIYPSGGERQLIKILTGREVPSQGFPADIGIICQNVGTAAAVYNAVIRQQPLLSRIVTVTGEGVLRPQNFETLVGTPVSHLIACAGGYTQDVERLLIGGPMMGYAVSDDHIPVTKTMNCILAVTRKEMPAPPPAQPCIRCGKCTEVCPAELLPQQLYWYAHSNNLDAAQDYSLFDCIECGCCAYVCPSHIPLVQYYRHAKAEIWAREKRTLASDLARQRHEARLSRLDRIKQEREARMARKKQALTGDDGSSELKKATIQAALERVKRKKELAATAPKNVDNLTAEQQQLIAAADKRRQQKNKDNSTG